MQSVVDDNSAMQTSSHSSFPDEVSCGKEIGPPTPTSFRSQNPHPPSPIVADPISHSLQATALNTSGLPFFSAKSTCSGDKPGFDHTTGVLLSELRPTTKISVLHSLFVVPTRPRHFRVFEPSQISYGIVQDDSRISQGPECRKPACLIAFEDSHTAKNFFRVVVDNAPFKPMKASRVDPKVSIFMFCLRI